MSVLDSVKPPRVLVSVDNGSLLRGIGYALVFVAPFWVALGLFLWWLRS